MGTNNEKLINVSVLLEVQHLPPLHQYTVLYTRILTQPSDREEVAGKGNGIVCLLVPSLHFKPTGLWVLKWKGLEQCYFPTQYTIPAQLTVHFTVHGA